MSGCRRAIDHASMKIFWAILGLLAIVTSVLVVRRLQDDSASGIVADASGEGRPIVDPPRRAEPERANTATPDRTGTQSQREFDALDEMTAELERSLFADPMLAADPFDSTALPVFEAPGGNSPSRQPVGAEAAQTASRIESNDKPPKAVVDRRDDGSMLVDNRFVLKGKGTEADPIQITWEFLVSAQETYQPRLGRTHLPDRLNLVHDKWVSISGYIAFPIMAASPDEMLMMLNQWDGCCIGVPPTPYDAIEVKLTTPATSRQKLAVDGSIRGILRVDPYLVRDWLVSLYLMDDARLLRDSASENRAVRQPGAADHVPGIDGERDDGGKSGSGSDFWESDTP